MNHTYREAHIGAETLSSIDFNKVRADVAHTEEQAKHEGRKAISQSVRATSTIDSSFI